jgi:hypothetical protein
MSKRPADEPSDSPVTKRLRLDSSDEVVPETNVRSDLFPKVTMSHGPRMVRISPAFCHLLFCSYVSRAGTYFASLDETYLGYQRDNFVVEVKSPAFVETMAGFLMRWLTEKEEQGDPLFAEVPLLVYSKSGVTAETAKLCFIWSNFLMKKGNVDDEYDMARHILFHFHVYYSMMNQLSDN